MAKQQPRILTGQVVAVTGGARGIGRAMAQAFLDEGMRVAIGDVDVATAKQTAEELGRGTVAFELDVTRRESVEAFADSVEQALGPIDVFINNAERLLKKKGGTLKKVEEAISVSEKVDEKKVTWSITFNQPDSLTLNSDDIQTIDLILMAYPNRV